jgi:hypothetical protein
VPENKREELMRALSENKEAISEMLQSMSQTVDGMRSRAEAAGEGRSSVENTPASTVLPTKQCGTCHGSGTTTCSSCYGKGGRFETRTDYDWEGNNVYRDEWVNCYTCSAGIVRCSMCGGKGEVYA